MQHNHHSAFVILLAVLLCTALVAASAQAPAGSSAQGASSTPVNLNTATPSQLDTLPGIGPKVAARIVEYRQKNGGFKKVEELMNVQGIGEKLFLKLKPLVTVAPAKTERQGTSPAA
jgi:competence protein ComEA